MNWTREKILDVFLGSLLFSSSFSENGRIVKLEGSQNGVTILLGTEAGSINTAMTSRTVSYASMVAHAFLAGGLTQVEALPKELMCPDCAGKGRRTYIVDEKINVRGEWDMVRKEEVCRRCLGVGSILDGE